MGFERMLESWDDMCVLEMLRQTVPESGWTVKKTAFTHQQKLSHCLIGRYIHGFYLQNIILFWQVLKYFSKLTNTVFTISSVASITRARVATWCVCTQSIGTAQVGPLTLVNICTAQRQFMMEIIKSSENHQSHFLLKVRIHVKVFVIH